MGERIPYYITSMATEHLIGAARLEELCFAEPWSLDTLRAELAGANTRFLVAIGDDEGVWGYVGMNVILDEGYLNNLAVAPDHRRMGVGKALMERLLSDCRYYGLKFLTLEARPSNAAAIAIYRGLGFVTVGTRKKFYRHPTEDGLLMTKFFEEEDSAP